jgi:hypothetical protein
MNYSEFVTAYDRPADVSHMRLGEYQELMEMPNEWSRHFGITLIDYFKQTPTPEALDLENIDMYLRWCASDIVRTEGILVGNLDGQPQNSPARRALTALNFHTLNISMIGMWRPILTGGWESEPQRKSAISISQKALALNGLLVFERKQAAIRHYPDFYQPQNEATRTMYEGRLNEIDTAIILLELAKKLPNGTVVPAPYQFDHIFDNSDEHATMHNIDFVVCDGEHAVGVQAKTSTALRSRDQYDASRVVIVDGRVDLGNQKRVRTKPKSSDYQTVSWGGLVSLHHLKSMPRDVLSERVSGSKGPLSQQEQLGYKFKAHSYAAGFKSNNGRAAKLVGDRILRALSGGAFANTARVAKAK